MDWQFDRIFWRSFQILEFYETRGSKTNFSQGFLSIDDLTESFLMNLDLDLPCFIWVNDSLGESKTIKQLVIENLPYHRKFAVFYMSKRFFGRKPPDVSLESKTTKLHQIDFQRYRLKRKKEFEKTCQIATLKKQYYKEKNCAQLFQKSLLLLACEPE